jgi:hypothetical protein
LSSAFVIPGRSRASATTFARLTPRSANELKRRRFPLVGERRFGLLKPFVLPP